MTIGEFASRCGLSAKILRTYAGLGVLVPSSVDSASGYRYYDAKQLEEAAVVALLRRSGVPVADLAEFLNSPSGEQLEGWERSLRAEVHARQDALAEVRARLGLGTARTRGVTMVEVRPVEAREELGRVFDLLGAEVAERIDTRDFRFGDLDAHFPDDQPLMLVAVAESRPVGGALAFRNDNGWATLRIIAVVEAFRHRGIGRRLVERTESEARLLGVEGIGLGTGEAVGFWFHLGYTPNLLFQWVYEPDEYEHESEALLDGPLRGLHHWRSSFNDVPQLFVELDEPRLDLLAAVRDTVNGCHVGFMMSKKLHAAAGAS
ncbi:MAG: GNAT family N-acetyltransferase [Actinomycetota bacterium]|nr:GNAT family N-acetyltransferase [Actinomycetota bacterium]